VVVKPCEQYRLELKLQDELNLPCCLVEGLQCREPGIGSATPVTGESKSAGTQESVRIIQVGVVQDVENIGAESHSAGFAEPARPKTPAD